MNVRSLVLATSAVLAATGCSDPNFEKRNDGVIVFNGEASSSRNMDESRGVFVREGDCILFETTDGTRVAPVLFEGVSFGNRDRPRAGLLVFDQEYLVQGLTTSSPLLDADSAMQLAATCGAPLAFASAVSPIDDGLQPQVPPLPEGEPKGGD